MPCMNIPPTPKCPGPEGGGLFKKVCTTCKAVRSKKGKKIVKYCHKNQLGNGPPPKLYSWGKKKKGGKLEWILDQDDSNNRTLAFKKLLESEDPSANRRGPGLYLCDTLTGSAEYCPKVLNAECVLVEVTIGNVVPCLNIFDTGEQEKFQDQTKIDATSYDFGIAPVLIHFTNYQTGHWYVLKTPVGCTFSLFDGSGSSVEAIESALDTLSKKQLKSATETLMRQLTPDVRGNLSLRVAARTPLPESDDDGL